MQCIIILTIIRSNITRLPPLPHADAVVELTEVDYRIVESEGVMRVVIQRISNGLASPLVLQVTPLNITQAMAMDLRPEFEYRLFPIEDELIFDVPLFNTTIPANSEFACTCSTANLKALYVQWNLQ